MFSLEIETLARLVIDDARERNLRIVTAESCTGGLVAGALCAVAGASATCVSTVGVPVGRAEMRKSGGANRWANTMLPNTTTIAVAMI